MIIELAKSEEAEEIQQMVERSIRAIFPEFYPSDSVEYVVSEMNAERLKKRMTWTKFYVVKDDEKIIGCGSIGKYYDCETEGCLFNIFVDPAYQKRGIGTKIIKTLESDEITKNFKRIEVHAGIPAIPFYKKMGYEHKNGELVFDDGHFDMEKFI